MTVEGEVRGGNRPEIGVRRMLDNEVLDNPIYYYEPVAPQGGRLTARRRAIPTGHANL